MGKYDAYYNAIEEIKESLTKELFGTEDEETLNNVEPLSAYVTGILFPQKASELTYAEEHADAYNPNDDINIEDISESDDTIIGANRYKPSTMGISVVVPATAKKLNVVFRFGTYRYERKDALPEQENEEGAAEGILKHFVKQDAGNVLTDQSKNGKRDTGEYGDSVT